MGRRPPGGRRAAPFPWDDVIAFGLGELRLAPRDFWSMTPRELVAAAGRNPRGQAPPTRQQLARLMQRYPDKECADE
ncbi:MAG: phage tail assembly chaperone [Alphaproteobacteria bacterium]|nr:phage tail assembly chaperone [Alphaproteobacteria bacterium]